MKIVKVINKILTGLILILVFFFLVGITYSYFTADLLNAEEGTTITADSGHMRIVYSGGPDINAQNIEPSIEPFAKKNFTVTGTNTTNEVDTGYKITLVIDENTFSNNAISYTLESNNTSGNGVIAKSITERKNVNNTHVIGKGKFVGKITNGVHNFTLKLYFYETGEDQSVNMRKMFKAHINTEEWIDVCAGGECLGDKILAQGGGASAIESKGIPDFSKMAVSQTTYDSLPETAGYLVLSKEITAVETGLYSTADEYGTSYYYRGEKDSLNNNLIFGGFQWKIVRINGDGSIRIIYNGTEAQFNTNGTMNQTGEITTIGRYAWNTTYSDDAKYVGYMYGGTNGTASSTREEAVMNQTDSNAKVRLDNWYRNNIEGKNFEAHIEDSIFCNDRQLDSGEGFGTSLTTYMAYKRVLQKSPTLKCYQKNDRFTVRDITLGNGALIYPVGLLNVDEASMAGIIRTVYSSLNYLYINQYTWLMSPYTVRTTYSNAIEANMFTIRHTGEIDNNNYVGGLATSTGYLRPVINLKPEILVTGEGTATNPFRVIN